MTSATDIITYVGVPLAVLGVLPILYTFAFGILTLRRIRASLIHHGHKPLGSARSHDGFSIRSSPMTSLIEVELPRYTIALLDRNNEDYWKSSDQSYNRGGEHNRLLERAQTTLSMIEEGRVQGYLRGGSWRAFHWRKLIVGRKLYRIQYEDELREPPAEIEFSDLIHFLLDWGAVPDSMGWEKLRSGGLWTPAGTVLLRKPDDEDMQAKRGVDWVLRTGVPDESDGVLTLTTRWTPDLDNVASHRGAASLAPGWGRLRRPTTDVNGTSIDKKGNEKKCLCTRINDQHVEDQENVNSDGFRFRVDNNRVSKIYWETANIENGITTEPFRVHEQALTSLWFTSAAFALNSMQQSSNGLWGFELPENVTAFVLKPSVPCGVLVILGILPESEAPQWSSEQSAELFNGYNTINVNPAASHHSRYLARQAAQKIEATMPPEQARVHKMNREAAERRATMDEMHRQNAERRKAEERRITDAIASPKMGYKTVAELCARWLIDYEEVDKEWDVEKIAEAALYLFVVDQREDGEARNMSKVLEEWMGWDHAGGMRRTQIDTLGAKKVQFCLAACLVAVVAEAASKPGRAGVDMQECLKMWRKVRVG